MKKRIVILGSGESGTGAAILAHKKGYDVFVSDGGTILEKYKTLLQQYNIPFEEKKHTTEFILTCDEVIKSPGIPEKNEIVKALRKQNKPIISEIEFAYRYKGKSKIVAITGTNGKSTTTSLIYHICTTAGLSCALVGNIGNSFALQVALDPKPIYVTEISSFQLDDILHFRADISILLNITEDHLDRYEYKYENYIKSKFKIIQNQLSSDYFIYNDDDEVIQKYIKNYSIHNLLPFSMNKEERHGAYIKNEEMLIKMKEEEVKMSVNDFTIIGKHNQYNSMAAGIAAVALEIRDVAIRTAMQTFEGLEHRLEHVLTIKGVKYINDSKATNINGTWNALESMNQPTILILGGVDKGNDYSIIEDLVTEKVKAIICLGLDNKNIIKAFHKIVKNIQETSSAYEAVEAAYKIAEKEDVVLLSPACASFDLFANYEDRGRKFKEAVKNL